MARKKQARGAPDNSKRKTSRVDPADLGGLSLPADVSRRARRRGPIEQSDNSARELFWQLLIE
jgi:hypothetical protein